MAASRTNWTGVIYGLSLSFFAAYQLFKLPPALPVLLERYGYDRALAGGFMSIYALAGLLFSVYAGRLIERHGAARPIHGALALMIAGNLVALAAPQWGAVVLAGRALEGTAFAVLAIAGPVLANREASPRHLHIVIGLTASWIPFGQILATAVAPAAFAVDGWQLLWGLAIVVCLLQMLWTARLSGGRSLDLGPKRPAPVKSGPGEGRPADTASGPERLALGLAAAIFMVWSGQYFAAMTWLPQYLVETQGLGLETALLAYLLPVVVLVAFNLATGMLLRAGVPLGPLLTAALASQAAIWWLLPGDWGSAAGIALLVAYGIGAGICPTCLFAMPSAILGQARAAASAFGVIMTGRNIGVLIGPILIAQIFKLAGDWNEAAPVFAGLTLIAVVLGLVLSGTLARVAHGTSR